MVLHRFAAPLRTHDLSRVVELHPDLRPSDVLVADRGFCSSPHLALLVQAGMHAVFRLHQQHIVDFTPGRPPVEPRTRSRKPKGPPRSGGLRQLGDQDQGVAWRQPLAGPQWMDAEQFAHLSDRLAGRARQYRVHRTGFRVTRMTLVTTLRDAACYTVAA